MVTFSKEATTFKALSHKASLTLVGNATTKQRKLSHARNQVFNLGSAVGELCHTLTTNAPLDPYRPPLPSDQTETQSFPATLDDHPFWSSKNNNDDSVKAREEIYNAIGAVFWSLVLLTTLCNIDLRASILKKMELNAKKYPAHLCKGRSGKYTEYSDETGITKTNQSMLDIDIPKENGSRNEEDSSPRTVAVTLDSDFDSSTVPGVTKMLQQFAMDRKWSRYHLPRNIVLAMIGEIGELAEIFQVCVIDQFLWIQDFQ